MNEDNFKTASLNLYVDTDGVFKPLPKLTDLSEVGDAVSNGLSDGLNKLSDTAVEMVIKIKNWYRSYFYVLGKRHEKLRKGTDALALGTMTDKRKIKRIKRIAKTHFNMSENMFNELVRLKCIKYEEENQRTHINNHPYLEPVNPKFEITDEPIDMNICDMWPSMEMFKEGK